ncbi:MAG: filamentous hemagglutinin N-terminal domain-containing protein, partial [Thiohalocapsa sp.]
MPPKDRRIARLGAVLRRAKRAAAAAAAILPLAAVPLAANPLGGQVVGGQATIATTAPGTLTIEQSTPRAAINWQSFNIAPSETTRFVQPSARAIALNRVKAGDPSVIAGKLSANGQLVLVNPSGIVFTRGAQVNVNSLIATPTDISTADFMAGRMNFSIPSSDPRARIVNNGQITVAEKGLAALVGPGVANNGVITARLGKVVLGGAQTYTLDFYGDGLIKFDVGSTVGRVPLGRDGKPLASLVANAGRIDAAGGTVLLTADAAAGLLSNVIDMPGTINARTYTASAGGAARGAVSIDAGIGNRARVGGAIDVSGLAPGETGGSAAVTGGTVELAGTARIDARGHHGGGNVSVGGGPHGADPLVRNALAATISAGAAIDASATGTGNGGTVAVWSEGTTIFDGTILATGGKAGGNGGWVETSGKQTLSIGTPASVDASARLGSAGRWLLDPDSDITITSNFHLNTTPAFCFGAPLACSPTSDKSTISPAVIAAVLDSGTSVTVTTSSPEGDTPGNILVGESPGGSDGAITMTGVTATSATLTLKAGDGGGAGGIFVNSPISDSGAAKLSLALNAGGDVSFANAVTVAGSFAATAGINPAGTPRAISQTPSGILSANGSSFTNRSTGGTITLTEANNLAGTVTLSTTGDGADASLTNAAPVTIGAATIGGNLSLTTTGAASNITLLGDVAADLGQVTISAAGKINQTSGIVSTAVLAGSSVGGATLNGSNQIGTFGPFSDTGSGSAGISLSNDQALTTTGAISSASGPITLKTTTGDLTLAGDVTAAKNQVTLDSPAAITQTSGAIDPGSLLILSAGSVSLLGDNTIDKLAASLTGAGSSLAFNNTATTLAVDTVGGVSGITTNNGAVTLTTTSSGDIALHQPVAAGSGKATLIAAGAISQQSGAVIIAGDALFTSSATGSTIALDSANKLAGTVSLLTTGIGADASLTNATPLTLGLVSTGGNLSLTTTGTGSTIKLSAPVLALNGSNVTLTSAGTIDETGAGFILADTLSGSAVGTADFGAVNLVHKFGPFHAGDAAAITLVNGQDLRIAGVVGTSGDVTLAVTGAAAGDLTIAAPVSAGSGKTATLSSVGTITESAGGAITAGNLVAVTNPAGATTGDITLDQPGANTVGGKVTLAALNGDADFPALGTGAIRFADTLGFTIAPATKAVPAGIPLALENGIGSNGTVTVGTAGDLTIAADAVVTGSAITLGTLGKFTNNAGAGALSAVAGGHWLVYSTDPNLDADGGLVPDFIQYGAAFTLHTLTGSAPAAAGNGFLYSLAPVLKLTGVTKVYDGTTALPTAAAGYTTTGIVAGDSVTADFGKVSGSYATAGVGTSIDVTLTTLPTIKATRGGVPVFGYAIAAVTDAPIGTITPAALTIAAADQNKTYGESLFLGTTAFTAKGLVGKDTVSGVTLTSAGVAGTATVGDYVITPSAALGAGLGNYTISYVNATLSVSPALLTVAAADRSKTYGENLALGSSGFTAKGLVNGDTVSGVTLTSAGAAGTVTVGDYVITPSAAVGTGLTNYT